MAKRRKKASSRPSFRDVADVCAPAAQLLATLEPSVTLPAAVRHDRSAVTEIFLDHLARVPVDPGIEALTYLVAEPLTVKTQALIAREHYFFEAPKLALLAIGRLYALTLFGERETPLENFLDTVLERTAEEHRDNADALLFSDHAAGAPKGAPRALPNTMARLANHGDFAFRRACWKMWVEHKPIEVASRDSGIPLERLEALLVSLTQRAIMAMGHGHATGGLDASDIPPVNDPNDEDLAEEEGGHG
jgi:hypothetical protein